MIGRKRRQDASFEAVPAYVVADKTDHTGKRLGFLAVGLLVLLFTIGGYIQAAKNGAALAESSKQRQQVIDANERITRTLDEQTKLIFQLQEAIRQQNIALKQAGVPSVDVPLRSSGQTSSGTASNSPSPSTKASSAPSKTSNNSAPAAAPAPSGSAAPPAPSSPAPTPTPQIPLGTTVCSLTGICLHN